MLLFFFITYYFVNIIHNSKFNLIINNFLGYKKTLNCILFIICILFFFQGNYLNVLNIFNSNKNFQKLTKLDDNEFLSNDYIAFLKIYKNYLSR